MDGLTSQAAFFLPSLSMGINGLGLVYTACYERTELIIYVARSGTLVACIFDLYVTTVSDPNLLVEL